MWSRTDCAVRLSGPKEEEGLGHGEGGGRGFEGVWEREGDRKTKAWCKGYGSPCDGGGSHVGRGNQRASDFCVEGLMSD